MLQMRGLPFKAGNTMVGQKVTLTVRLSYNAYPGLYCKGRVSLTAVVRARVDPNSVSP